MVIKLFIVLMLAHTVQQAPGVQPLFFCFLFFFPLVLNLGQASICFRQPHPSHYLRPDKYLRKCSI